MRKSMILPGAAAALTLVAAGMSPRPRPPSPAADQSRAEMAIAAAKSHAGATHFGDGQSLKAVATLVDADGASHVRMHRTYRGLEVVGGDLVVHQTRAGAWKGSSQTLDDSLDLQRDPGGLRQRRAEPGPRPQRRDPRHPRCQGRAPPTLVVDATGSLAASGLEGAQRRHPGGRHPQPPGQLRRRPRPARCSAPSRRSSTVDGSGQSLYGGTVPLQLTLSGSTYQLKDPTRGNTYTTDMKNKTDSMRLPGLRVRLLHRHAVHQPGQLLRQRQHQQPGVGRRRRAVRHQRHLGLLQARARPQRDLRQRHAARSTGCTTATTTSTPSGTAPR